MGRSEHVPGGDHDATTEVFHLPLIDRLTMAERRVSPLVPIGVDKGHHEGELDR